MYRINHRNHFNSEYFMSIDILNAIPVIIYKSCIVILYAVCFVIDHTKTRKASLSMLKNELFYSFKAEMKNVR